MWCNLKNQLPNSCFLEVQTKLRFKLSSEEPSSLKNKDSRFTFVVGSEKHNHYFRMHFIIIFKKK